MNVDDIKYFEIITIFTSQKTIVEAKQWWHKDGCVHSKNIFLRNHKGNRYNLFCFQCDHDLAIHDLEYHLKEAIISKGLPAPGDRSYRFRAVPRLRWQHVRVCSCIETLQVFEKKTRIHSRVAGLNIACGEMTMRKMECRYMVLN